MVSEKNDSGRKQEKVEAYERFPLVKKSLGVEVANAVPRVQAAQGVACMVNPKQAVHHHRRVRVRLQRGQLTARAVRRTNDRKSQFLVSALVARRHLFGELHHLRGTS